MTFALRDRVLLDGTQPGIISGVTYGRATYDVLLVNGQVKPDVDAERLAKARTIIKGEW